VLPVIDQGPGIAFRPEFGNPFFHILIPGVKFLLLKEGVEYPEPGGGIATAAGRPLPPAIARRKLIIRQMNGKPGFPPTFSRPAGIMPEIPS